MMGHFAPAMLVSGVQVGKYVLGKKLGQGGFGVVFRAHDASLDREVALKFLTEEASSQPQVLQRFLQEARSAAKIAHPGIVTVFECGQLVEAGNAAYIAMELLDGESLTDRLARAGRLPFDHAMEITRQVASALEAAHNAGIVHRDLKPDNVFLVRDPAVPGGERVKVLDFGIAKLSRSMQSGVQTQSMQVFGTPRYMSPEQCKSAAAVDHRSDIYTLGCILFELVCGRAPFAGAPGELIAQHVLIEAPPTSKFAPDVPPELEVLIGAMLAKEPGDRPQTMAAVQRRLESGGAMSPGVAPTLLPGMPLPPRIGRPSTAQGAAGSASPTTLGAAASSAVVARTVRPSGKRRAIGLVAGGIGVAVLAAIVAVVLTRHDDKPAAAVAANVPQPPVEVKKQAEPQPKIEPVKPQQESAVSNIVVEQPTQAPKKPLPQQPRVAVAVKKAPDKQGLLSITTKPACEVTIDGGATFHTPVRGYKLAAGRHTIAIANADLSVAETVTVDIDPNKPESVSRDYSDRIKPVVVKPPVNKDKTIDPTFTKPDKPETKDKTINPFGPKKS
jgi:serine/threonine-protein kinase